MNATATLTVDIEYDPEITDPESLAVAMDRLMETILSTPGIVEEYGNPRVKEFFVVPEAARMRSPTPPAATVRRRSTPKRPRRSRRLPRLPR